MEDLSNCPNCGDEIKASVFKSNLLTSENESLLINTFTENKSKRHCSKCSKDLLVNSERTFRKEFSTLKNNLNFLLNSIPVISINNPEGWKYTILEMVTGQSVTGTGAISDFTSSFTDFFGGQSGSYNTKLQQGEERCISQLRKKAFDLGANAVIATDIDYSEVGAATTGMLMVCMAGTAVRLNNANEVLEEKIAANLDSMPVKYKRFNYIKKFSSAI